MCFAPQRRALFPHPNLQKWCEHVVFCTFWLRNVLRATTACTFSTSEPPKVVRAWCVLYILTSKCASRHNGVHFFDIATSKSGPSMVCFVHFDFEMCFAPTACTFSTSELPKVVRHWGVLYILTSKCASRHNGVHFFDISTSKSGPRMVCFVHFDFKMCFAPQRRALFRHRNFQKRSDNGVFCTFWLQNVLRATTACNFSSLIWPAGSAPAALASLLLYPPEPQIIGKTVFRDFPTFSRICIFFLLTLSLLIFSLLILLFSLPLPCSAFHLSILSEVWLLNFLRISALLLVDPWGPTPISGAAKAVAQASAWWTSTPTRHQRLVVPSTPCPAVAALSMLLVNVSNAWAASSWKMGSARRAFPRWGGPMSWETPVMPSRLQIAMTDQ